MDGRGAAAEAGGDAVSRRMKIVLRIVTLPVALFVFIAYAIGWLIIQALSPLADAWDL